MNDTTNRISPHHLLRDPLHLISLGFGSGCAAIMPGTVGTLIGVLLYLPLASLPLPWYLGCCGLGFALGIPLCTRTGKALGVSDHPAIVWDEVIGYLVTMIALPFQWQWMLAGFVMFRLLDIAKPWPIGWLDRQIKGGLGVMLDDLAAGLIGLSLLNIILYLL
jgi:phosphatidylglycerophosphatase A